MKSLARSVIIFLLGSLSWGGVSTTVYMADGVTPLLYNEIMLGTNLKIKVSSTEAVVGDFYGYLLLSDSNIPLAELDADYWGYPSESIYPAAGDWAYIEPFADDDFYNLGIVEGAIFGAAPDPSAGDWFVVDYNAVSLGDCVVGLYNELAEPPFDFTHLEDIEFTHVRTRDFNNNAIVGFDDYVVVAKYWQRTDCAFSNNCDGADLEPDGDVDFDDLANFIDYWLEKTR